MKGCSRMAGGTDDGSAACQTSRQPQRIEGSGNAAATEYPGVESRPRNGADRRPASGPPAHSVCGSSSAGRSLSVPGAPKRFSSRWRSFGDRSTVRLPSVNRRAVVVVHDQHWPGSNPGQRVIGSVRRFAASDSGAALEEGDDSTCRSAPSWFIVQPQPKLT